MTRRHFELIAAVIADNREAFTSNTRHARFAGAMADALARTNDRFDRERFILAAMPRAWVGTGHSAAWELEARA
jgi:hypothetical protein